MLPHIVNTVHLHFADETNPTPSEYLENILSQLAEVLLNLRNKTQKEIEKELYVDFSTLDTHTMPEDEKMQMKVLSHIYMDAFNSGKTRESAEKLHPSDRSKYDLRKFNDGIVALGVENFTKAATQFCKEEAAAGEIPIVSIGSGDGTVEKEIIAQYRERFGKEISIQLVDPDPKFHRIADFETVDHLIRENPRIVGNCVALIIWPYPTRIKVMKEYVEDNYDVEAVQKLQPRAALIVYESTGGSGSNDFRIFLHEDSLDDIPAEQFGSYNWVSKFLFQKKECYGLDNYAVLEVARQKIILPRSGTLIARMVKIVKTN